jgi:hypothetical protein
MPVKSHRVAAYLADTLLSVGHLSTAWPIMSLYTYVQRICQAGAYQARTHQGNVFGHMAYLKM